MGLFGHGGWLSKAWHGVEDAVSDTADALINKPLHELNKLGRKLFGDGDSWYVGYDSRTGTQVYTGNNADHIMANGGFSQSGPIRYYYGNYANKTNSYKGNVAKTANSIKQGGMTKNDLIEYNIKHPNETANTPGTKETSLNSNTAIRGK